MSIDIKINPVVLAGGAGSRLWPLSRMGHPKQYLSLLKNKNSLTMLQQTFSRLTGLSLGFSQLICNKEQRFLAAEQTRQLIDKIPSCSEIVGDLEIVLEPEGRNTAPAVIIAALRLQEKNLDYPMLILSADHAIKDEFRFRSAIVKASTLANKGFVVTLGVNPTFPSTGYGYIECGELVGDHRQEIGGERVLEVNKFVEKPDETAARNYLSTKRYLWNSGIFVMKPSVLIEETKAFCPELLDQCRKTLEGCILDLDFIRLPEPQFIECDNISIDYAIMERTQKAVVVELDCDWSDVGDLETLYKINIKDEHKNVCQGDTLVSQSRNCFVKSTSRLIAVQGIEGLAVIETKDAVLVTPLAQAQNVKELVKKLELEERHEFVHQREVYRPWGSYEIIDSGHNYQVKRIIVKSGARLSLQKHKYRSEHWVVVEGVASVHIDGIDHSLCANDSIYIPKGAVHCLSNETNLPLVLVEVQSGSYLGEDDIERLDDIYGRC